MKLLKAPEPNSQWRLIRDQRVREAEVRAETGVKRLEEEGKVLRERKDQVDVELSRMRETEAGVNAHRKLARWWGAGFVIAALVTMLTAWWTLDWFLSLTWEKGLIALTIFILPLIGWAVFLLKQGVEVSARVQVGLGLFVVVCAMVATAGLGAGRMAGVLLDEDRRQQVSAPQTTSELTNAGNESGPNPRVARVKKLLAIASMVSVILFAIACEISLGLAFHEYYRHMTVVRTVWPFYRERATLADEIADNVARQEEVKRWPEILHAQLTAAGLAAEAAQMEKVAAEARAADEKTAAEARAAAEAEAKANSLGRLVKIVLVAGAVLVLSLLAVATAVFAEERHATVVILDLSTSMASEEFARDVQAVEGAIERLPADTRFVVLGVTEASFSATPLFVQTSPKNTGRFGEYLSAWRGKAIREWRLVAERLQPSAKGSDILGALARASIEFAELPQASKTLILLSDMRQVGQGVNLEKRPAPPVSALEQPGLMPRLPGVQVWMLGVHADGIDVGHWRELQTFWCEYFQRAGAEVKAFSPNRRVAMP
ncbi:MAG TPA: hypothetical protein VN918_08220 [Myxococcaceae bacterium]|nr:hypothetical protein [Myxococcaceae bacterium]